MFKTNQPKEIMKQCKICDDKPTEIFKGFLVYMGVNICKPCMNKKQATKTNQPKETMTIVHSKNSTIGYDTVNKCVASVRTPENTSYETM